MKKIYRNVVQIEVLSDEPLKTGELTDLENVSFQIGEGDWSGRIKPVIQNLTYTGKEAVEIIQEQGSDPEFFNLDQDGNEI